MKFLSEYRDAALVHELVNDIKAITTRPWTIMEVCGGQTHSLVKNGLLDMLPKEITMVHGPGCPVCVTPISIIDEAILLSKKARSDTVFVWRYAACARFRKKFARSKIRRR